MNVACPVSTPGSAPVGAVVDVHIVVVTHGHFRYLEPCLTSIFENTDRASLKVTLVDNLREPRVTELIRGRFPQVELVVNEAPKGFAENNNSAFAGTPARYCFLLNPDTVVKTGAVDKLMDWMDAHPELGACAPKLVYPDGQIQLSCRRFPSVGSVILRRTPLRLLLGESAFTRGYTMADWDHNSHRSIDWMFGAAIFARREAWIEVGPLDTTMFMFCEDIDWCLRCHRAGWGIDYVPDAVIVHDFDEEKYNRYFTRGRFRHYKTMLQFFFKYPRYCLRW
ncbi:MAG: glycosyltransferase family 2 protein [Phycisphaerales bacterium]|nr:glycosyltransferase family 2 protein [Phycisphaerales bacterium]